MKEYTKPNMNIARFSVTDIVTTSDKFNEDPTKMNIENAQKYLQSTGGNPKTVMDFTDQ